MPEKRTTKAPSAKARPTKRAGKQKRSAHAKTGSGFARIRSMGSGTGKHSVSNVRGTARSGSGASTAGGTFTPEVLLTRRNLLIGAGVIGGIAAVGGISSAASSAFSSGDTIDTISVPQNAVTELADLNEVPYGEYLTPSISHRFPAGTLVWADTPTVAACLCPTKTSHPLNTINLLYFSSNYAAEVLKQPVGMKEGFDIFEVRCSEQGLVWTECNIFENTWRIYTARLNNATLENIQMVDEGDSNWITPSIAASENAAFWQVVPDPDGQFAKEKAVLRVARFGDAEAQTIYESLHSFATRIVTADNGVVIAPRINSSTKYFELTKILASDFSVADQMTLPHGMTPCNIGYGKSGFSFAFENIYNYGEGISNLGTYTPMKAVDPYHYDDLPWFRFGRTPTATPMWCDEWFVVKSTRAICGVHFASKNFFMIDIPSNTDSYGEYLVSSGSCPNIIGLSQITSTVEGEDDYALLRMWVPTAQSLGPAFSE